MKRVFLNLTAHELTKEQIEAAKRQLEIDEFLDAKDVIPKHLLWRLRQCPADEKEVYKLATKINYILDRYAYDYGIDLYVHLPAGSPAFMWCFANVFSHKFLKAVFSHTRRITEEVQQPDGSVVKKSVFRFERFIVF